MIHGLLMRVRVPTRTARTVALISPGRKDFRFVLACSFRLAVPNARTLTLSTLQSSIAAMGVATSPA